MTTISEPGAERRIQGQLLRKSEHREVALFLRDGGLWVADFIDGEGVLIDATTWVRFNCGALVSPQARRRMVLEAAVPLSPELAARIARLAYPAAAVRRGPRLRLTALLSLLRIRARLAAVPGGPPARGSPPSGDQPGSK